MKDDPVEQAAKALEPRPGAVLSAEGALRLVLILLALWTFLSGLTLTFFQDASEATIGGGLQGGQGQAAQRLLGVHLLVLSPIYGMLAWEPKRFRLLLWLPYAAQGGVVAATLYDIMSGDREFRDGALPLIVAIIFFVLLLYVTFARRELEPPEATKPPEAEPPVPAEESPPS